MTNFYIPYDKLSDQNYIEQVRKNLYSTNEIENVLVTDSKNHTRSDIYRTYIEATGGKYDEKSPLFNIWFYRNNNKSNIFEMPSYEYDHSNDNSCFIFNGDSNPYNEKGYLSESIFKKQSQFFNEINGEIEDFEQGQAGDCWVLASIEALKQSKTGKKLIKNSLRKEGDSYKVSFRGVDGNNKFNVTEDDFTDFENCYLSSGDPDVRILEIATKKLLETKGIDEPAYVKEGRSRQDEKLYGGFSADFLEAFTGKDIIDYKASSTLLSKFLNDITGNFFSRWYMKRLLNKAADSDDFCLTAGTVTKENLQNSTLDPIHAHAIKSVDKNNKIVTLIDPHDTSVPITLSYDEFLRDFTNMAGFIN